MSVRRILLGIALVVLLAAAGWSGVTAVNMVRYGPEATTPAAYWSAVAIVLLITVALLWTAWRVADRLFGDGDREG